MKTLPKRQQLLWSLINIQQANHHGDPIKAFEAAETYRNLCSHVKPHDVELIAYTDLNLAVHLNDQFKFREAFQTNENLIRDPAFGHLSPLARGRALSSMGQTYSLIGQYDKSDACFAEALALLERAASYDPTVSADIDQTHVYRALNAVDGGMENATERLRDALGDIGSEAVVKMAESTLIRDQYHHHLLVRSLWFFEGQEELINTYLKKHSLWITGLNHPWELINCYRALFFWETNDDSWIAEALKWFFTAIEITEFPQHGPTMRIIGAMIATIAACCLDDVRFTETAKRLLTEAEIKLPAAGPAAAQLRCIAENPDPDKIDQALAALPFNYH
jgi:tetratricopeptide (TPR) repeat protein